MIIKIRVNGIIRKKKKREKLIKDFFTTLPFQFLNDKENWLE